MSRKSLYESERLGITQAEYIKQQTQKRVEALQAIEKEQRRPFEEAAQAEQQARAAQEAFQRQLEEQARVKAQIQAELTQAERQATIAGKRSAAVSSQLRSKSILEQAQTQQAAARTAIATQAQQRKQPGATVGQPGRARTRVASGLGIGGYGGTRAARVSPTGLNI